MFVLNILLAAFLVKTEIKKPGAAATSTPLTLERPKPRSSPQLNAPPDQGSSLGQGSRLGLNAPPVEAGPAALPSTLMVPRPATKALRVSKTPIPRVVPKEPLGQAPAPARDPAASSGSSANVAPPRLPASFGVPGNAGPAPNAPATSALVPSAIGHGLTAKRTPSGSMNKVASVGLPGMEKGLVIPKMPVAPISPKIEIVPRPAEKLENCGDDHDFIACPQLKIRYETPFTSEDH